MNTNSYQRPTATELYEILDFWDDCMEKSYISISHEKDPEAIYTSSRAFTFRNLPKPINSSIITPYLNDDENNNHGK